MQIMQNENEPVTKMYLKETLKEDLGALETRLCGDLASKTDLEALGTRLRGDLGSQMASMEKCLRQDMSAMESGLRQDLRQVHVEIARQSGELHDFRREVKEMISEGNSKVLKVVGEFAAQVGKIDRHQTLTDHDIERIKIHLRLPDAH